jgi:hypothetical protein
MFVEILIIEINIRSPAGEGLDIELISWCALINSLVRVLGEVNLKAESRAKQSLQLLVWRVTWLISAGEEGGQFV